MFASHVYLSKESLLKGKTQYGWSPCTNWFRLPAFYVINIFYLCYKTSYLYEEVNCTEPPPSVSIPWPIYLPHYVHGQQFNWSRVQGYKTFLGVVFVAA